MAFKEIVTRPFNPCLKNKGDEDSYWHLLILHALDIVDGTTTYLGLFLLLLCHLLARHLLGDLVALTLLLLLLLNIITLGGQLLLITRGLLLHWLRLCFHHCQDCTFSN